MNENALLADVKFDEKGLVCAIAQDAQTLRVLMVAWMNAEALQQTVAIGFAHYYSRSRQKQWMKGEESGHTQKVHELRLDCDGDVVIMLIEQAWRHCLPHRPRKLFLPRVARWRMAYRGCGVEKTSKRFTATRMAEQPPEKQ